MNVTMEPQALEDAVNRHIGAAVEKALGGYDVQKAVAEALADEVAVGVIREAVKKAAQGIDSGRVATALAQQIERTATAATVTILRESFVEVIAKLRGIQPYEGGREVKLAKVRAELGL